jgi:hypothetical protein
MKYWQFKRYVSEDGDQPRTWYEQQGDDVQAYMYGQIDASTQEEDTDFIPFTRRYSGLGEIPFFIPTATGMRHVGLIGFWQLDTPNFIVLLCCEIDDTSYAALQERALRYKHDWQGGKGEVYEFFSFLDEDT